MALVNQLLKEVQDEMDESALHIVRTFLQTGVEPNFAHTCISKKDQENQLKLNIRTKGYAAQICNFAARKETDGHTHYSSTMKLEKFKDHRLSVTKQQADALTRTSVESQSNKPIELFKVKNPGGWCGKNKLIQYSVGMTVLVWWARSWHASVIKEIGGEASVSLRIHLLGRDASSDLWIMESDWWFRIRIMTTPADSRVGRGHFGRIGEEIIVKLKDPIEAPFWGEDRYPVGVIIAQLGRFDCIEVEVVFLGSTEKIIIPNCFSAPVDRDTFESLTTEVEVARTEAQRLIDGFLVKANLSLPKPPRTDHDSEKTWCRIWHGVWKISGLRVLAGVMRQGGSFPDATTEPCWPQCQVRVTDPITRAWRTTIVPPAQLLESSGFNWVMQGKEAEAAAMKVLQQLRIRKGVLVWEDTVISLDEEEVTFEALPDGYAALQNCYPRPPSTQPLNTIHGLSLNGVSVDVMSYAGLGGGDWDNRVDGLRVVVIARYAPNRIVRHLFPVWRQDWQSCRPWGINGGSLPGLRCLAPPQIQLLLRYVVNRLDFFEGVPVIRFPHRSAYPLGFIPFRMNTPPCGEIEWVGRRQHRVDIIWRASCSLSDGETRSRWVCTVRSEGEFLHLTARSVSHAAEPTELQLSLSVVDWCHLGFGPNEWLSLEQQQFICRRLLHAHSNMLHLRRHGAHDALGLFVQMQPEAVAIPRKHEDPYSMKIFDMGLNLAVDLTLEDGQLQRTWFSARDLHDCCPSLQIDPFAVEEGFHTPQHPDIPSVTTAGGVGLSPVRSSCLRLHKVRPGITHAEAEADRDDFVACWEELRVSSALRDMEPLARIGLLQRFKLSLKVKTSLSGAGLSPVEEALVSCPAPLPSSLAAISCSVDSREDNEALVNISPPVAICAGATALGMFNMRFDKSLKVDLNDGKSETVFVVKIHAAHRGIYQKVFLDHLSVGEFIELWASSAASSPQNETLIVKLIRKLQLLAGRSNISAHEKTTSRTLANFELPETPISLFLREVTVEFVRTVPVSLRAYDTGRGVLLISIDKTTPISRFQRSQLGGNEPKGSGVSIPEGREIGRYMLPRTEMGRAREPLLMTTEELDRLLLGYGKRGHGRRNGLDKATYIQLTLEKALSLETFEKNRQGVAHWAAPLVAGAYLVGLVTRVHPNGFIDVRLKSDSSILRRIDPSLVKCPIRPDKTLHTHAKARATSHLTATSHDEYDHLHGLRGAVDAALRIGDIVELHHKHQLRSASQTMKSLHYHRGEEEYTKYTTTNEEATIGDLPEHLSMLLMHDEDMAHLMDQSFTLELGSIRMDTGYKKRLEKSVYVNEITNKVEEETPEVIAVRERRHKVAEAFHQKQFNFFFKKGEDLFEEAEKLGNLHNEPMEEEEEDSEEEEPKSRTPIMVDVGETESQSRLRVLQQRKLYLEASQCFRLALRRSPTIMPAMYGRMALSFLRARDFTESVDNAEKALIHFPDSARLFFIKGQALLELNRVEEAFSSFDSALTIAKKLREEFNGRDQVDTKIIESYRKAAYVKKHKHIENEVRLGEIEIESSDRHQREIDENLNMFNVYDSVPALLEPLKLPRIEVASKMVNPLAIRLKVCPPTKRFKRHRKKLKKKKKQPKLPSLTNNDEQENTDDGRTEKEEDEEITECFIWEEEDKGEKDKDILIEMEIETEDDIVELCVRKEDDMTKVLDTFFEKHHKMFTQLQIQELRVELKSKLSESQR